MVSRIIEQFQSLGLKEINKAALMKRIDSKFILNLDKLPIFLKGLKYTHKVLEVNGQRTCPYKTVYFDSENLNLFTHHHNGKLHRIKLRTREYKTNNKIFNEIKIKNNKGKTTKFRLARNNFLESYDKKFQVFTRENSINSLPPLSPQLQINFQRLTLVDKNFSERITVDTNLCYSWKQTFKDYNNLAIIEVKREPGKINSQALKLLRELRCNESSFSKYCVGIAVTRNNIKKNNFKPLLRQIEKVCSSGLVNGNN